MFDGSRLTVARQRRSLTKRELAFRINVTARSISGFESGEYPPTDENIRKIAEVLWYPVDYFFGDPLEIPDAGGVSFRAMSKMLAKQRDAAIAAGALAFVLSDWADRKLTLPDPDLLDLRGDSPELAALSLRQYWGLGELPVKNMIHLLEAKGIRVFSLAENCKEIDAYSLWRGPRPFVFLNTLKSAERRRYDAAHELGHLVLHKHASPNGINAEKEANEFAAAFLMPSASMRALGRVPATIDAILKIKKKWNVSAFSVAVRLHGLGMLSTWHYNSICIEMQRRGWREREPLGSRSETSQIWRKAFALLRNASIGLRELTAQLRIPEDEIVKLVFGLVTIGLPSSVLGVSGLSPRPAPDLRLVTEN